MKRRCIVLGPAVPLILVLLAALAGPATAKSEKWIHTTATFNPDPDEYGPPTLWPPWKGEYPYSPFAPFVPVRSIDEYFEGTYESGDPNVAGYAATWTDGVGTLQGGRYFTLHYVNKTTLWVGALGPSGEDRWEITAIGEYRYDFVDDVETHYLEGVGHGVAGNVKGWVMKFYVDFILDSVVHVCYLGK